MKVLRGAYSREGLISRQKGGANSREALFRVDMVCSVAITNLFFANRNITELFFQANWELDKISASFKTNTLPLNEGRTKHYFSQKSSKS